jgi:hypothetical protein
MLRRGMNKRRPRSFRNSCHHDSELFLSVQETSYKSRPNARKRAGAVIVGLLPAFFDVVGQNARLRTRVETLLTIAHASGLARSSKSLFPALVQCHLSVWKPRRLPRQLDDRLSLLAAIRERHQEKAFIALLDDLDTGCGLRHGQRTQFTKASSSRLMPGRSATGTAYPPGRSYRPRRLRAGLAAAASSIQDGAWSLASASPRMSRSTPAAFNRGATEGLRRRWSSLKPASRGHLFLR